MCATSRNRLQRVLSYLARVLWIMFAFSNLMSLPFGMQAYYTQILATTRSVPAVSSCAQSNAPDGCPGSRVIHCHLWVRLGGVSGHRRSDLLATMGHLS